MKFVKRKEKFGSKWFRDVTWDEIREAERLREKVMEFELTDIEEDVHVGWELDRALEENIKYILKREGLYDPERMGSVVIPMGALNWECDDEQCWYVANFEVFDKSGNEILVMGTATGTMYLIAYPRTDRVLISDMVVTMPVEHVKKLKTLTEAARRLVASIFNPFR